jgi:hypothetical protein
VVRPPDYPIQGLPLGDHPQGPLLGTLLFPPMAMGCTWARLWLLGGPGLGYPWAGSAIILPGGQEPMGWVDHGLD